MSDLRSDIVENDLTGKPLSQKIRQVDPKDLTIVRHCCAVFYRNVVRMDCLLLCLNTLVRCPHKCVNDWYSTESIHLVSVTVFIPCIHLCLNTLVRCPHKCILDGNEGCHADRGASRGKHIEGAWSQDMCTVEGISSRQGSMLHTIPTDSRFFISAQNMFCHHPLTAAHTMNLSSVESISSEIQHVGVDRNQWIEAYTERLDYCASLLCSLL